MVWNAEKKNYDNKINWLTSQLVLQIWDHVKCLKLYTSENNLKLLFYNSMLYFCTVTQLFNMILVGR